MSRLVCILATIGWMLVGTAQAQQFRCSNGECKFSYSNRGGSPIECQCLYDEEQVRQLWNTGRYENWDQVKLIDCKPLVINRWTTPDSCDVLRLGVAIHQSAAKAALLEMERESLQKDRDAEEQAKAARWRAEAAKQQSEVAKRQADWEKQQAEAAQPENQLKTAYANYIEVKRCYESREGYVEVFINDAELSRAKDMVAGLEQKLKDSSMDLDALWKEANATAYTPNTMMGPLNRLTCQIAFDALSQHYLKLFPEAATTEKDF